PVGTGALSERQSHRKRGNSDHAAALRSAAIWSMRARYRGVSSSISRNTQSGAYSMNRCADVSSSQIVQHDVIESVVQAPVFGERWYAYRGNHRIPVGGCSRRNERRGPLFSGSWNDARRCIATPTTVLASACSRMSTAFVKGGFVTTQSSGPT